MDFALPGEIVETRDRIRHFVRDHILPVEADPAARDAHENIALEPLAALRDKVRAAGLWAPAMPRERGGLGLSVVGMAACYEEMNYSIFGPACFNSAAPDDGNMIVLNKVGTEPQKARWLQPIIDGKVRSAFAMTEPAPGSGSDPSMMRTRAERVGDGWRITGVKWFISGAEGAAHFILVARTSDDARRGLSAFLFHRDQPGWQIVRRIPIMGPEEHGGHCELRFDGLVIPDENRLMEVGDGLRVTQIRLGTARLTHCMRWLGLARRSIAIGRDYVERRESGGKRLIDIESIQQMLASAAMQIDIGRLLTMRAAWKLDQGDFARKEVCMAKVVVADALHQAVDTALQLNGARGYSKDTPLEWIYRYARQARLVDGASEVHKMVLSRMLMKEGDDFWGLAMMAVSDPAHARKAADFDSAALAEVLCARGLIERPSLTIERLTGGQSNPTYCVSSNERRYVLRRKPSGPLLPSAHAIDREFRVMQALRASDVPVPRVYFYSDDTSLVGSAFYVMEFLDGRVLVDQSLPGMPASERTAIYNEMNRVIAALHRVDYAAAGLAEFGKTGNYFARQITRWTRQCKESRTEDIAALDALMAWLPEHIPPGDETALVHGDYRLDNLVFDPREPRVIGVLDWELSTLGHPLADFSYNCMSWHIPASLWRGIAGLDLTALGIPDEATYVRRYCEATGTKALEHWNFYLAYNLFRLSAIMQGIAKRALEGNAAGADAIDTGRKARPLAELGWTYAQRYEKGLT